MSVRKVVTRRSNHFRVYVPSLKNRRPTPGESILEGKFARFCEISPLVKTYEAQPSKEPLWVDDHLEDYYPDFRLDFFDGTDGWVETKPEARLLVARVAKKMNAAKIHFNGTGRRFMIVTDRWLSEEPRSKNINMLMYYRRDSLTPVALEHFQVQLNRSKPTTVAALCSILGNDSAWHLLGLGIVGIDLEQEVKPESHIFLNGGHRHADFFS